MKMNRYLRKAVEEFGRRQQELIDRGLSRDAAGEQAWKDMLAEAEAAQAKRRQARTEGNESHA